MIYTIIYHLYKQSMDSILPDYDKVKDFVILTIYGILTIIDKFVVIVNKFITQKKLFLYSAEKQLPI